MKQILRTLVCAGWCALALVVGTQAQTPANEAQSQTVVQQQLMSEIRALRRELLQQAIEFQQWKLEQITRELQQAQAEQQRLFQREQLMQQELNDLAAASNGKNELETLRHELMSEQAQQAHRRQPVDERVSTLTAKAQKEETRLRQLTDKLKAHSSRPGA